MKKIVSLLLTLLIVFVFAISASAISIDNNAELSAVTFGEHVFPQQTPQNSTSRVVILPEDFGDGTGYPNITYSKNITKDNVYLSVSVQELGDGYYYYTVEAHLMSMPSYRGIDSLGACADESSILNDTKTGWISYNENIYEVKLLGKGDLITINSIKQDLSDITTIISGDWQGVGVQFQLPKNKSPYNSDAWAFVEYSKFVVHLEFKAKMTRLGDPTSFNVAGSYHHSTINYTIKPTLSMQNKSGTMAIAISENSEVIPIIAELDSPIDYVPTP